MINSCSNGLRGRILLLVNRVEGGGGQVTRDNGLGSVGFDGIGCHGEREVVWVWVRGALMWKGCVGVGTIADWVAVG